MTTFTMQDLTPEQQQALTKHEEMHKMFQQMGGDLTGGKTNEFDAPTTQPTVTKEEFMEYGMNNPINISPTTQDILNNMAIPHAPEPQPTPTGTDVPDLWIVVNNLGAQLQLLATVIKEKQGNSLNVEDQSKSLQECVSLTLQQADWFKDLIRHELIGGGIEDLAKEAVEEVVEEEVESYFSNSFDPTDHFDFGDAVQDAVSDQIDDVVSDKIDDVVQEKFDDFMENVTIKLER